MMIYIIVLCAVFCVYSCVIDVNHVYDECVRTDYVYYDNIMDNLNTFGHNGIVTLIKKEINEICRNKIVDRSPNDNNMCNYKNKETRCNKWKQIVDNIFVPLLNTNILDKMCCDNMCTCPTKTNTFN